MTSQDNQQYLTVDIFNAKMDAMMATIRLENEKLRNELRNEIQTVKSDLHSEIQSVKNELHSEIRVNSTRIDGMNERITDLQSSVSLYFVVTTIFVALLGIVISTLIAFAPRIWAFLENRKSTKAVTPEQVQEIVDRAIAKAFSSMSK